jgi:hypothetical protein
VKAGLDPSLCQGAQPHYIAPPPCVNLEDPIKDRWGFVEGKTECVEIYEDEIEEEVPLVTKSGTQPQKNRVPVLKGEHSCVRLDREFIYPRDWRECLELLGPTAKTIWCA